MNTRRSATLTNEIGEVCSSRTPSETKDPVVAASIGAAYSYQNSVHSTVPPVPDICHTVDALGVRDCVISDNSDSSRLAQRERRVAVLQKNRAGSANLTDEGSVSALNIDVLAGSSPAVEVGSGERLVLAE